MRKNFDNYLTLSNKNESSSLLTRSEKISVFKFALEYQKIDSYKRTELQTKELSTRSFSRLTSSLAGLFSRFLVRSFSPASARWTVRSLTRSFGYSLARSDVSFARDSVCSFVCVSGLFGCSSVCPVLLVIHGHKLVINNKI